MKNLLEYIVIHLVDNPDAVSIEESEGEHETLYLIKVAEGDVGRVIGKNGSVISAIRQIARIRAIKEGVRIRVDLAE